MPLILPGNVASATAGAYEVANSCRFNDGDSPQMTITPGSAGNQDKFTFSFWVKRGTLGANQSIASVYVSSSQYSYVRFDSSDRLDFYNFLGGGFNGVRITNRLFRDCGAWYHIVVVWDSGNATGGDRMKVYVNGTEETSFATSNTPNQHTDMDFSSTSELQIGSHNDGDYFDGYLAEMFMCNAQAYTASTFGEFDEDSPTIWKPKDCSGDLSFGTNGFYLDFKDSANLGNDANGGTDFTEVNLAAADQATDTPTNNFCVMNPLANKVAGGVFSQGNTIVTSPAGNYAPLTGTIGLTKGKWYFEMVETAHTGTQFLTGIAGDMAQRQGSSTTDALGETAYQYGLYAEQGTIHTSSEYSSYDSGLTPVVNEIVSCYLDLDNNKIYFSEKGGSIANSGTGFSITASASVPDGVYFAAACYYSGTEGVIAVNFGGSSGFAISSGNTDANGYGNFEYSPNDGGGSSFDGAAKNFLAICTKNLGSDGG